MLKCPMPKQFIKYKSKWAFKMTARQAFFTFIGVALALVGYFALFAKLTKPIFAGFTGREILCTLIVAVFGLFGFCEIYETPFEKIVPIILKYNFFWPTKRKYITQPAEYEKEKTQNSKDNLVESSKYKKFL